jgi:hypothetical protein
LVLGIARCVVLLALACRGEAQPGPGAAPSSSVERPILPPRTEVVARADALALEGTRLGGPPGASLVFEAAELRERLYRIERREVDALEAAELFGTVARTGGEKGCRALIRQALIEGELRADPSAAYLRVYAERARATDSACRAEADRALLGLSGYEPHRDVLVELEARAKGASKAPAAAASVSVTTKPTVVVPSVTKAPSVAHRP